MNNMLLQACLIAQPHTKEVYFVGGCVRDMLLGKAPHDYDIVVDGDLDLIANDLSDNGCAPGFQPVDRSSILLFRSNYSYRLVV